MVEFTEADIEGSVERIKAVVEKWMNSHDLKALTRAEKKRATKEIATAFRKEARRPTAKKEPDDGEDRQ